ncbi:MAG: HAMP domain-containing sensor histidine kinase [Gemmatimonadales bacterium]
MTFRSRLVTAFLAVVVLSLGVSVYAIRLQVGREVVSQYERRVDALAAAVARNLARESDGIEERLEAITAAALADNRLRSGIVRSGDRSYVLDWAEQVMRQTGLDMLQLQDSSGRILSSGHFRNEYDLVEPDLPRLLATTSDGFAVARARAPERTFPALVRVDSLRIGGRRLFVVGGTGLEHRYLARLAVGADLGVSLDLGVDTLSALIQESADTASTRSVVRSVVLPLVRSDVGQPGRLDSAHLRIVQSLAPLDEIRATIDRWFLVVLASAVLLAVVLAGWLASHISRPLAALARETTHVELDRLDVAFAAERGDEVGELARAFAVMTGRLRRSLQTLREVERRAAVGDVARQVNHDVKNGLVPIRNVLRHLTEVADGDPEQLAAVFAERRGTLETAVEYLEHLAARYAALYPKLEFTSVDVNAVVRKAVASATGRRHEPTPGGSDDRAVADSELEMHLAERLPPVRADVMALRRVVENLVGNAVDATRETGGTVTVRTESGAAKSGGAVVRITVADTGPGMTREQLDRAFGDFHTSKAGGTGLGLTIVRRLVNDLGGSLRAETEPGVGTRFAVELDVRGEGR